MRSFLYSVLVLIPVLTACGAESSEENVASSRAAATSDIQSMERNADGTYYVVCRDGQTLSAVDVSEILANKVCSTPAHTCATSTCPSGFRCEMVGGEPMCREVLTSCASVSCPSGYRCEMQGSRPMCVADSSSCAAASCPPGYRCTTSSGTAQCVSGG